VQAERKFCREEFYKTRKQNKTKQNKMLRETDGGAHRFNKTWQDAVRFVVRELEDCINGSSRLEACFPEHDCADATDLRAAQEKSRAEGDSTQGREREVKANRV
jgi:hypothetical protein